MHEQMVLLHFLKIKQILSLPAFNSSFNTNASAYSQNMLLTLGSFTFDLILLQILSSVGLVGLFKKNKNRPNNNLLHIEQVGTQTTNCGG